MFMGLFQVLQGFFMVGYLAGGNSFPLPLSANEEREQLAAMAEGSEDARNILIEHNLRLVAHIVKKYYNHARDSEDLISIGTIGLIKGISSFNIERGVRLATYAAACIENEVRMHIRANKKYAGDIYLQDISGTDREGNEVRLEDRIACDEDTIEDQVCIKQQTGHLYNVISKILRGREKTVIELRYGLGGAQELTQREIAQLLDISRSYVSRIEKKALGKLHKEF